MAGNTPYQVGPGDSSGVVIPGKVGFYGDTPVSQGTYTALAASTTNVTTRIANVETTLSTLLVSLAATGIVASA